jgi:hypothetical protein
MGMTAFNVFPSYQSKAGQESPPRCPQSDSGLGTSAPPSKLVTAHRAICSSVPDMRPCEHWLACMKALTLCRVSRSSEDQDIVPNQRVEKNVAGVAPLEFAVLGFDLEDGSTLANALRATRPTSPRDRRTIARVRRRRILGRVRRGRFLSEVAGAAARSVERAGEEPGEA